MLAASESVAAEGSVDADEAIAPEGSAGPHEFVEHDEQIWGKKFRSISIERSILRDAIATYRWCGVADLVTQVEA